MKKNQLIILFLLCILFCQSASGQSDTILDDARYFVENSLFENLSKVRILVEGLPPVLKNTGLTELQLKDEAELRLRRVGIFEEKDSGTFLYIDVSSIEIDSYNISYSIEVSLRENVFLERNKKVSTIASTWNRGSIGKVSKARANVVIKSLVSELIDEFVKQWKRKNGEVNTQSSVKNSPISTQNNGDSPFTAVYVGGNSPPEVEVFNDSDRTLYLDLGQNKLIAYTIPPKTSKTFKLTDGFYGYKATAPRVSPLEGKKEFKKGYKYSWRFTIVKYSVPN